MGGNLQGADIWPTASREPITGNTGDTWPQLQQIWFFGMTTAEQVDTGRLPSTTCSCSKWNTDEVTESSFDCICNSCVCISMCECSSQVHTICIYTRMNRTVHSSRCFTRWKIRNQVVSGIYSEFQFGCHIFLSVWVFPSSFRFESAVTSPWKQQAVVHRSRVMCSVHGQCHLVFYSAN